MPSSFQLSHLTAGFTAVLVGYTSSVILVIQAATSSGATPDHIASWLLILGVALGVTTIGYSWYYKVPVLTAWSTPGAAMLITVAPDYSLQECIGAFILSGFFVLLTGLIKPINQLIDRIPAQVATAMLAAILLPFCLKAFAPLEHSPILFFSMFIAYLISKSVVPRYTMLILLLVSIANALYFYSFSFHTINFTVTKPSWVTPTFSSSSAINIALPLYIITMLSQNLPGIAMLNSYGYKIQTKSLFLGTGLANMMSAPFGGFSINLAAISAAICMNKDVDLDANQRYQATIWAGIFYLLAGCWASAVVSLFLILPTDIVQMLAGFALLGTLLMCLKTSFSKDKATEPALLTFLISLSGVTLFGINAPILGLLVGIALFKYQQKT